MRKPSSSRLDRLREDKNIFWRRETRQLIRRMRVSSVAPAHVSSITMKVLRSSSSSSAAAATERRALLLLHYGDGKMAAIHLVATNFID